MSLESVPESGDILLGSQPRPVTSAEDSNSKAVPAREAINDDEGLKGAQFETIFMPSDYNPLDQLEKFEALEKFKNQFGSRSDATKRSLERRVSLKHYSVLFVGKTRHINKNLKRWYSLIEKKYRLC